MLSFLTSPSCSHHQTTTFRLFSVITMLHILHIQKNYYMPRTKTPLGAKYNICAFSFTWAQAVGMTINTLPHGKQGLWIQVPQLVELIFPSNSTFIPFFLIYTFITLLSAYQYIILCIIYIFPTHSHVRTLVCALQHSWKCWKAISYN